MIRAICHGCGKDRYCSMSYTEPFCRKCWPERYRLAAVYQENRIKEAVE